MCEGCNELKDADYAECHQGSTENHSGQFGRDVWFNHAVLGLWFWPLEDGQIGVQMESVQQG